MKYLQELKTTGEDCSQGSMYWKRLTLDNQVSMYISAARDMGHDVGGVLYDVIRKTGLRPLGKGTETPESYEQRILQQIGEEPDRYYQRGIIVRTADEIVEHDSDVWQMAELIRFARNTNRWPRYVGSCMTYNVACDYWPVCSGETTIDSNHYATRPQMNAAPLVVNALDVVKTRLPILSPSALATWRACPRKFFYAYELRRRRVSGSSHSQYFGKLIHKAIEVYHHKGIDAALERCAAGETARDGEPAKLPSAPHDIAHARALVRGYYARWADAPLRVLATEQPFTRALRNPDTNGISRTFELGGVVDAVIEET